MKKNQSHTFLLFQLATLVVSCLVFLFWFSIHYLLFDPYKYIFTGALYEMMALPMLLALGIIPIIAFAQFFIKKGFSIYSFLSILIIGCTILLLYLKANNV